MTTNPKKKLKAAIMGADLDSEEVIALLCNHFSSVSDLGNRWLGFGREPGDPLLRVRHPGNKLTAAEVTSALTDSVADELLEEIDAIPDVELHNVRAAVPMMSTCPVPGCFRSNVVEIRPAGPESLHPSDSVPRPFILEMNAQLPRRPCWLHDMRLSRLTHEMAWTLSVLLRGVVWLPRQVTQHHWVTTFHEGESCPQALPEHRFDPASRVTEHFPTEEELPIVPFGELDCERGRPWRSPLRIPDDLLELLAKRNRLDGDDRRRFVQASCWFNSAIAHQRVSQTTSYLGLINSVESLLDSKPTGEPCGECRRPTGAGPTKAFQAFLEEHVAPSDSSYSKKQRQRLYDMRSKMVHQGFQLDSELAPWRQPTCRFEQLDNLSAAHRQVTIALTGWLRSQRAPHGQD